MSETQKATAASGSPSKTPEEITTPPEEERPYLQTPTPSEQGDSPIVQEPEEPLAQREESPRKTSLVIVESADDQPQAFERLEEDAAFQKVRLAFSIFFPMCSKTTRLLLVSISLMAYFSLKNKKLCQIN